MARAQVLRSHRYPARRGGEGSDGASERPFEQRRATRPTKPPVAPVQTQRPPLPPAPPVPTLEQLFGGPRPASFSRGLEPAFLLIDKDVMLILRERAAALGLGGYDSLAKRILREHVHEYSARLTDADRRRSTVVGRTHAG